MSTQHFEGTGDGEVTLLPGTVGAALARIAVADLQQFTVEAFDADGRPLGTVVDTIHPYTGSRRLNFEAGPPAVRLQVTTDGVWTIDVTDLDDAPRVTAPGHYEGVGDQVLIVGGDPTHARFRATATSGRFVVDGYGIFKAPLVDEPSPYTGTVVTPREAKYVLENPSGRRMVCGSQINRRVCVRGIAQQALSDVENASANIELGSGALGALGHRAPAWSNLQLRDEICVSGGEHDFQQQPRERNDVLEFGTPGDLLLYPVRRARDHGPPVPRCSGRVPNPR